MKKAVAIAGALLSVCVVAALASFAWEAFFQAQRADYGWTPSVAEPAFTATHPVVLIDEGHNNASTAGITGRYWPFARLLRADGYAVRRGTRPFTPGSLDGARVLVIANAMGAPRPQAFGINLPGRWKGDRSAPAFTPAEIQVVRSWVDQGGSLLLVADHAPCGDAAAGLASALGVTMHKGFTEVPGEQSDPLLFSEENGRLGDHAIVSGGGTGRALTRVMTFTGQSLDAPPGAAILLRLPASAVEYVAESDSFVPHPAGAAQGLAFEYGKGRVVILGEAAMMTAQVSRRVRFGMNMPGNDNQQFVLNTLRWLTGKI